jgi:RNA polymerase sigma factor (sigma-70 family)
MDEIAALLEPEIPRLRRYAYALTRNSEAADDLVQDTLERAISRWPSRRRDGSLRPWLFTIERNLFLGSIRRSRRRGEQVGAEALEQIPATDTPLDSATGSHDVLAALDLLPEEQRSVLLLVAVEELSYEDAARALGVPLGTIMSRLSRAREKMRAHLNRGRVALLRRVK